MTPEPKLDPSIREAVDRYWSWANGVAEEAEALAELGDSVIPAIARFRKEIPTEASALLSSLAERIVREQIQNTIVELFMSGPSDLLRRPISNLGLSVRARNCLRGHVQTVGDVVAMSESDVLDLENLGIVTLMEIKSALAKHGLSLSGASPFPPI